VEIPEGTQTGTVLRLQEKDIPHLERKGRGDEYIVIKVMTPANLDEKQKGAFEKIPRVGIEQVRCKGGANSRRVSMKDVSSCRLGAVMGPSAREGSAQAVVMLKLPAR
jgi:DnaJ-class molecular chaperone